MTAEQHAQRLVQEIQMNLILQLAKARADNDTLQETISIHAAEHKGKKSKSTDKVK